MAGLRSRLERLRAEAVAVGIAARDPRTPWYAKLVGALTVGLALSPVDPIPDIVPVLGHVDDLVFVPLGVALAWRLAPAAVRTDARRRAEAYEPGLLPWLVAGVVVLTWVAVGAWAVVALAR